MHKIKFFLLSLLFSFVFSSASFSGFAQEIRKPFFHHDLLQSPLLKELNLSEDQKKQIQQVQERYRPLFREKRETLKEARFNLEETMGGSASDQEVRKKIQAFQKAQGDFMEFRFEQALAIRNILSLEQRKKFREMRKEMKGKMRHAWREVNQELSEKR